MSRIETTATTTAVVVLTALLLIWAATSWPWIFLAFVTISGVTVLVLAFVSQLIGMKLPMDAIGPEIEQLMRYGYHGSKRFRDLNSKRREESPSGIANALLHAHSQKALFPIGVQKGCGCSETPGNEGGVSR